MSKKNIIQENIEEIPLSEQPGEVLETQKETREKVEEISEEEVQKLREAIEKTDIDDSLKTQASQQAQSIKALDEEKKIKKLLALAGTKGVIYAVSVAQKMDDPYLLDRLHDMLVKEGYYKKYQKK